MTMFFILYCALQLIFNSSYGKSTSQLSEDEETRSNNTELKRYVKEYDFRPPIFGSFAYDPVRQEFNLLKTAAKHEKKSLVVSTLLSSEGTTTPSAAGRRGRTRKRAHDLEVSTTIANDTGTPTQQTRAQKDYKREKHLKPTTKTSSKGQALVNTDLHIADDLKEFSSQNYSNYMKQ